MRKVLFILGELEEEDLGWLVRAGRTEEVPPGTSLIREGEPLESFFIVLDGQLAVTAAALGERPVAQLGAGEVVGDMSLLDARPPNATVTASTAATVFAIPQATLRAHLRQDHGFAARFFRALCVFLANRLNRTMLMAGRTDRVERAEARDPDELDPDLLEQVSLAGARFAWFVKQARGGAR